MATSVSHMAAPSVPHLLVYCKGRGPFPMFRFAHRFDLRSEFRYMFIGVYPIVFPSEP